MSCWDILGIEPTQDRERIRAAYEQQLKFASQEESRRLADALREALGEPLSEPEMPVASPSVQSESSHAEPQPLDAQDGQVVREVVIQVNALLNDSKRSEDVGIWKAILCEPPADKPAVRSAIAERLEAQLKPTAENGGLPAPVARFLGDWFEWHSLKAVPEPDEPGVMAEPDRPDDDEEQPPQMVNFWPAVVGWIIGLAILAAIFGGMGGH
ncbi:hypothetical protein [Marinobacter santoriniensis]|uniref:hypothetical protein n=1 Tax=Marinobacter santoriniensis TaxID=523742 RepID=UPI00034CD2AF|nr:hypothetical protein [Marinobacter santoriniensis]